MGTMGRWLLVFALSGCSLTLTGPDPDRPRNKPPVCATSKAAVAADGTLGTLSALIGIGVASDNGGAAAVPLLLGAAFIASAVHGNGVVNDCNAEMVAFANEREDREESAALDRQDLVRQQKLGRSGGPEIRSSGEPVQTPSPSPTPVPAPPPPPVPQPEARSPKPVVPPPPASAPDWSAFWREVP